MKTQDIQQLVRGFNTVEVFSGPYTVRVHEALDASYQGNKHRYFISVDLKFREMDAMHVGKLGYLGVTKAEATREAKRICDAATVAAGALKAAEALALKYDIFTNRYTVKIQTERLQKIIGKYTAEFVQ